MTDFSLFGLLIVDRDPFVFGNLPGLVQAWLQDAGGFAFVGLAMYLLYVMLGERGDSTNPAASTSESDQIRKPITTLMLLMFVLAILTYSAYGFLLFRGIGIDRVNIPAYVNAESTNFRKYVPPRISTDYQPLALSIGGLFALIGISHPFFMSLAKIRWRRIWALSKLGFLEAWRSRLFWVFLLFLIPFLFPVKWFFPIKPEDELRTIVGVSNFFMTVLLLLPAGLLAAFSIPNDIKNQNIYTVITKPVERFEIVFGRFVGYALLMTFGLLIMSFAGWILIRFGTSIDERAREETFKARVPIRGELSYQSRRGEIEGTNVGREFDYRKYIGGDSSTSQRAVWGFRSIPSSLTSGRDHVPCEFTFDIFRMTKGEENRGVDLVVRVTTWQCPQRPPTEARDGVWKWVNAEKEQSYLKEATELLRKIPGITEQQATNPAAVLGQAQPGNSIWEVANQLSEKYGYFEVSGKEIFDYRPDSIPVPVGLFKNALQGSPQANAEGYVLPLVSVSVKCNTKGQLLGMAEPDLYLLEGERSFDENFFKSSIGLWCRVLVVIAVAVTCSTYLAGVISFLAVFFLFLAGYSTEHLTDIASGRSYVQGPFKAINQLLRAEQPTSQADPNSALTAPIETFDLVFAWVVRRFINIVPDVYAYSWSSYVSEGFNIPFDGLAMNIIVLLGYILPWFILGHYLIRSREVAA